MTRNGATFPDIDPEIDQLLHPSRFYARPSDVVADQLLTLDERRAILSSWASDACAVESNPALRQPPHAKAPVTFDEIKRSTVPNRDGEPNGRHSYAGTARGVRKKVSNTRRWRSATPQNQGTTSARGTTV